MALEGELAARQQLNTAAESAAALDPHGQPAVAHGVPFHDVVTAATPLKSQLDNAIAAGVPLPFFEVQLQTFTNQFLTALALQSPWQQLVTAVAAWAERTRTLAGLPLPGGNAGGPNLGREFTENRVFRTVLGRALGWWVALVSLRSASEALPPATADPAGMKDVSDLLGWLIADATRQATYTAADVGNLLTADLTAEVSRAATELAAATRAVGAMTPVPSADSATLATLLNDLATLRGTVWPQLYLPADEKGGVPVAFTARMLALFDATRTALTAQTPVTNGCPAALLPIRLETRFQHDDTGPVRLQIRCWPDQIHVDSHVPGLSADEQVFARALQTATAAPGVAAADLWAQTADLFGDHRTAYLNRAPAQWLEPNAATPNGWAAAAVVTVAPDRWLATAYDDLGRIVGAGLSAPVVVPLQLNPRQGDPSQVPVDTETGIDQGLRWTYDFVTAEQLGWAMTITITPGIGIPPQPLAAPSVRIARLVVVGLRDDRGLRDGAGDSASRLADLLTHHRYTDGLTLVAPGTTTNNLAGDAPADGSGVDRHALSYRREVLLPATGQPLAAPNADLDDASLLETAFGWPQAGIRGVLCAAGPISSTALDAQAMNSLLWPATWGSALAWITGGTSNWFEDVRRFADTWLKPAGPLPTLRVGPMPYGVLPAMAVRGFADESPVAQRIAAIVNSLLPSVSGPLGFIDLDQVLARRAISTDIAARVTLSPVGQGNDPWPRNSESVQGYPYQQLFNAVLNTSSLQQSVLAAAGIAADAHPPAMNLTLPLVADEPWWISRKSATGLWPAPLTGAGSSADYLGLLATNGTPPTGSLLAELAWFGWQQLNPGPAADSAFLGLTPVRRSDTPPAPPTGNPGRDLRAAAQWLSTRTPTDLTALLGGAIDAASHRLDAWATALATYRLSQMRENSITPTVLTLGGYGYAENLVPAEAQPGSADSAGFLFAPSIGQATTAAVLHAGFLEHNPPGAAPPDDAPFAIDLSSRRARKASRILDGVRQGQSLGALLGYQFERHLVETDGGAQASLVAYFRRIAPLDPVANQETRWPVAGSVAAQESVRATDVVDGVTLFHLWKSRPAGPAGGPQWAAAAGAFAELADTLDAISDGITAAALHQLLAGNTAVAAATLDAVAAGSVAADISPVLATPRSGVQVTHRVLIAAPSSASVGPHWTPTPRTVAAGPIAAWISRMLPDPQTVSAEITLTDERGTPVHGELSTAIVHLDDLGIGPLDLLDLTTRPAELDALIVDRALGNWSEGLPAGTVSALVNSNPAGAAVPLSWVHDIAGDLSAALNGCRSAEITDLQPVGSAVDDNATTAETLDELATRVHGAFAALTATDAGLSAALPGLSPTEPPPIGAMVPDMSAAMAALRTAMLVGVPGAVQTRIGMDNAALTAHALTIWPQVRNRLAAAAAAAPDGAASVTTRSRAMQAQLTALFGPSFPAVLVMPSGSLPAADTYLDLTALPEVDRPHAWISRQARVHPDIAHLVDGLCAAEAIGLGSLDPVVAQLPAGHPWAGAGGADAVPDNVTSLVFVTPVTPGSQAVLVLKDLNEVIPRAAETAAITYHVPSPSAQAPQAILLAVPAHPATAASTWTHLDLVATVTDTFDLAKARLHDLADLSQIGGIGPFGELLPASFLPDQPFDTPVITAAVPQNFLRPTGTPRIDGVVVDGTAGAELRPGSRYRITVQGALLRNATISLLRESGAGPAGVLTDGPDAPAPSDASQVVFVQVPADAGAGTYTLRATDPDLHGPADLAHALVVPGPTVTSISPTTISQQSSPSTQTIAIAGWGLSNADVRLTEPDGQSHLSAFAAQPASNQIICTVRIDAYTYDPGDYLTSTDNDNEPPWQTPGGGPVQKPRVVHRGKREPIRTYQNNTLTVAVNGAPISSTTISLEIIS